MAALHGDESRLPVFDLDAVGDITVGYCLDRKKQSVIVRSDGILRCYDDRGTLTWQRDTGLRGGAAYAHEFNRHDADRDGLDEIFANWQTLTIALRGDGTLLWEDKTQRKHSDYIVCGDVDADGMFSVWNGKGERLYAISFLPSPSKRTWSDKHNGGSWSHAMPGGHDRVRRQIDLDANGRTDFILAMGALSLIHI